MNRVTLPGSLPGMTTLRDEWLGPNGEPLGGDVVLAVDGQVVGSGMDLAARWLGGALGLHVGFTAPNWYRYNGDDHPAWVLVVDGKAVWFSSTRPVWAKQHVAVAGITNLPAVDALRAACLAAPGRPE